MGTPDDAVCHNDRLCPVILYELQDFAADAEIGPHILALGEPEIQSGRLGILLADDSNRYLRRELVIRPVERDRRDWISAETAARFPIQRQIRASFESHPTSSVAHPAVLRNRIGGVTPHINRRREGAFRQAESLGITNIQEAGHERRWFEYKIAWYENQKRCILA